MSDIAVYDLKSRSAFILCVLLGVALTAVLRLQLVHWMRGRDYTAVAPICRVDTPSKAIALSFDDGPDPQYTQRILRLLQANKARGTFFLVGQQVQRWPRLVHAELESGMEIGNHTWSHPHLPTLTVDSALDQIAMTKGVLERHAAVPTLFRPPYGEIRTDQLAAIVSEAGLSPVVWTQAVDHYVAGIGLAPPEATQALLEQTRPGDILLAHDAHLLPQDGGGGRPEAMETLRALLPALRSQGYRLTTVSDLLTTGSAVHLQPRTWFWQEGHYCPSAA